MSKKSSRRSRKRKQKKTNVPQYTPPTESQAAVEEAVSAQPVTTAPPARAAQIIRSGMDSVDWHAEYPFVAGDLRSMGIVAALMVALLLGLNFFVN